MGNKLGSQTVKLNFEVVYKADLYLFPPDRFLIIQQSTAISISTKLSCYFTRIAAQKPSAND